MVASADGYLYVYNLDITEGGNCTLLKQHRFVITFKQVNIMVKHVYKIKFQYCRLDGKQDEVDCATVSSTGSGSGEAQATATASVQTVQNSGMIFILSAYFYNKYLGNLM